MSCFSINRNLIKSLLLLLIALSFVFFTISVYAADAAGPAGSTLVSTALCRVYYIFAGPIGKILAVLTLIMIGISFFMAKVTWTTAVTVFLGIGAIFGAPKLVQFIAGGTEVCTADTDATAYI